MDIDQSDLEQSNGAAGIEKLPSVLLAIPQLLQPMDVSVESIDTPIQQLHFIKSRNQGALSRVHWHPQGRD